MPQYTVLTVGHGELNWADFLRLMRPHHIEVLVDIRSFPYCDGVPWFNRDQLEHLARREGWEYVWLGGCLGPLTDDGRVDYLAKESEGRYRRGISQLLDLAAERRVCLLGTQADPLAGHRHQLIAQTLLHHDVAVEHVLHDGELMTAHADLFHGLGS